MLEEDKVRQFQMTLGTAPRAVWNQLEETRDNSTFNDDEWDEAKTEFIQEYTDDTNARDTVLAAVTTGNFIKPSEVTVKDHYTRIMELCSYIQMLSSDINEQPLSIDKKKIYFLIRSPEPGERNIEAVHTILARQPSCKSKPICPSRSLQWIRLLR